ncbi:hypothetical protein SRHO_G00087140 [Serrasalmus rhombeus]
MQNKVGVLLPVHESSEPGVEPPAAVGTRWSAPPRLSGPESPPPQPGLLFSSQTLSLRARRSALVVFVTAFTRQLIRRPPPVNGTDAVP